MSSAPETQPIPCVDPAGPTTEDTAVAYDLIPTRPSTPLPGDSAAIDLTPSHTPPAYTLTSPPSHDENLAADIAYHSSPNQMDFWDRTLQDSCQKKNGGLHAREYLPVQAVSPYRMRFPTSPGTWVGTGFGHLGRAFPSDETKLRSGIALRLEDSSISTFLPVNHFPINFIRLEKAIHQEPGYVIYTFISDLFSRTRTPQSQKAPTNLIAIPVCHMHKEAAHLTIEQPTLHQRILEEDYALPPYRTWENDWNPPYFGLMKKLSWSEEMEMEAEQPGQREEGEITM